jgi:translation initiation factor IF-2
MAQMNVAQFAAELKMPATALLEQLAKAGVSKQESNDALSEQDKTRLLDYLRKAHGDTGPKAKITLTRKQTSEIKSADSTGKARTIQVEVRKKRVFVKRDPAELAAEVTAPEPAEVVEILVPEPTPVPEPVAAPPVVEMPTPEPAPAVAPSPVASAATVRKSIIDPAQSAIREAEAKRQSELSALQAAEIKARQEREARARADAEARLAEQVELTRKAAEEKAKADAGGVSGTLHKPATKPGEEAKKSGVKKAAGNWKDDAAKKRGIKTRGDTGGGAGGWRGGPRGRHGNRHHDETQVAAQAVETIVREVHIPETVSVADLAHKMSVKATEVIKGLMKMGMMVTINQHLDQETAMIVVEEMGHKAIAAKLDDPDAFL